MKREILIKLMVLMLAVLSAVSCGGGGGSNDPSGYTVLFEVNGADSGIETISGFIAGETVPQPEVVEKAGFLFDGWYSSENFDEGTLWIFGDAGIEITGNTTLYAKWIECSPVECFNFSETGSEATITGLTDEGEDVENIVLPLEYNGKPVTTVAINGVAFSTALKSLAIGKSVTTVNTPLFQDCINITEIYVVTENSSFSVIDGVLYNKDATVLVMYPQGKTDTSFSVPESVENVQNGAFYEAKKLISVNIINPYVEFGMNVFRDCTGLASVSLPDDLAVLGRGLFIGCTSLESVSIPPSVEVLPLDLFSGCTALTTFVIPPQITEIGDYAFSRTSISSIEIPESVITIGTGAFGNDNLTAVNVSANNTNYSSVDGVLFNKDQTILYLYPRGTTGTSYTVPATVETIGADAFYHAVNLTDVILNEGLTTIKGIAFYECTALESVVLPSTLSDITYRVFESCSQLKTVEVRSITPPAGCSRGFWGTHSELKIYVPTDSVDAYKTTAYWSTYADSIYDVATRP